MRIFRLLYPSLIWRIQTSEPVIYLTFDDGPHPEVTPYVLDTLKAFNAKATFFCIGENIEKYPDVFHRIIKEGHSVGNHTQNHLNGWKYNASHYHDNIEQCQRLINHSPFSMLHAPLFRPPYGRIKSSQIRSLKKEYSIIMWDVLSRDWDKNLVADDCYRRVKNKVKPGSIVVFHDSLKAADRMKPALKKSLEYFSEKGYRFHPIPL